MRASWRLWWGGELAEAAGTQAEAVALVRPLARVRSRACAQAKRRLPGEEASAHRNSTNVWGQQMTEATTRPPCYG
jgi:hypothetical protein